MQKYLNIMKQLTKFAVLLLTMVLFTGLTSCDKDEPGSNSNHEYYSAHINAEPSYYWVIDMNPGDLTFKIMAWTEDGKKMSGKRSYSGKYTVSGDNIYVTWDHQSMNTMWQYTSSGIRMIGSSNPEELDGYTYYRGAPDFN